MEKHDFLELNTVLSSNSLLSCLQKRIAQSLKEEQMKQMSQESTFSDVQLEDPDGRRNSNAGPCDTCFFTIFGVTVICLIAFPPLYNESRECRSIKPTDIYLSC